MALIIPEGFAQITVPIRHVGLSREAVVTFGVEWAPLGTNEEALDRIFEDWFGSMGQRVDAACVQGPARAAVGTASGENLQVEGSATNGSPRQVSEVTPQVALLMHKRTARGGRRGRGRMFVPWALDEGQVQGSGFLEQAELDAANLAGEGLLFALSTISAEGGPFSMVILHVSGGSTAPGTPNIVTSFSADPQVATQRRRLGR